MKQQGFILIVSLIFLVILTMIGITMFSGVTIDERISGNQREKDRSIDAAQMALNSAETWLGATGNTVIGGSLNAGIACNAATAQPTVCNNLPTPSTDATTWPFAATLAASGVMNVSTSGGVNTYYSNPQYVIQFLGPPTGSANYAMYQVTASAQGGNNTATTVIQAVYKVTPIASDLGGG